MPLSEKALRAFCDAPRDYVLLIHDLSPMLKARLTAFQAALLEELRERFDETVTLNRWRPDAYSISALRALLSPPPPEPKWTVGDWVVPNGEKTAKLIVFIQGSDITLYHGGGHASGWHRVAAATALRPATDEEVRRARGEEQP